MTSSLNLKEVSICENMLETIILQLLLLFAISYVKLVNSGRYYVPRSLRTMTARNTCLVWNENIQIFMQCFCQFDQSV